MLTFLRRRVTSSLVPLLVVVLGVFCLARLTGDPARLYLPLTATPEMRADFAARFGLDQPIYEQIADYIIDVFQFDFGTSMRTGESAALMALRAYPATLQLAASAMLVAVIGAVVVGSWAALRPNSIMDRISSLLSMGSASVPDFWIAIVGIWIFAVEFGVLPTSGSATPAHWILPLFTLCLRPLGVLSQVVRGAMVSALSSPYVKVARAKGAGQFRVVANHTLRNAAAPALTVAGDLTVTLINGAVVVETIFGWPGIGNLMIDSILQRDFAVLQATVLVTAVTIFVLNIVIDVGYAALDPRVRRTVNA